MRMHATMRGCVRCIYLLCSPPKRYPSSPSCAYCTAVSRDTCRLPCLPPPTGCTCVQVRKKFALARDSESDGGIASFLSESLGDSADYVTRDLFSLPNKYISVGSRLVFVSLVAGLTGALADSPISRRLLPAGPRHATRYAHYHGRACSWRHVCNTSRRARSVAAAPAAPPEPGAPLACTPSTQRP